MFNIFIFTKGFLNARKPARASGEHLRSIVNRKCQPFLTLAVHCGVQRVPAFFHCTKIDRDCVTHSHALSVIKITFGA